MDSLLLLLFLVSHILFSYIFSVFGSCRISSGRSINEKKKKDEKQRHVLKKKKKGKERERTPASYRKEKDIAASL